VLQQIQFRPRQEKGTIFGVDKSRGDVVAIVAVNNGEASKVKFLGTDPLLATSSNLTTLGPSTINPAAWISYHKGMLQHF